MASFAWFPVDFSTSPRFTWDTVGSWTAPNVWASNSTLPPSYGNPGAGDNVFVVSLNLAISPPAPLPSVPYNVTINLDAGGPQTIASLGLAFVSGGATATAPVINISGVTQSLTISGALSDHFTASFPNPIGNQTFAGGGTITLALGASLDLGTTSGTNITVTFKDGSSDKLILEGVGTAAPGAFASTITGFNAGDSVDLTGVTFAGATHSYDTTTSLLVIDSGGTAAVLKMTGTFTSDSFTLQDDGNGKVLVVTCFAAGTMIRTPDGERPVETLAEGDLVVTCRHGERVARPIRWIGRRRIDLRRQSHAEQAQPVRIRRDAFGPNEPARDLLLSPNHSVYAEGVLIPARYLINDTSVSWAREMLEVTYFHLELDEHVILLAEGLPTESLVPGADRSGFANGGCAVQLHPDFHTLSWEANGFAPLVVTGKLLEIVRARLAARVAEAVAEEWAGDNGQAALCA